MSQRNRDINLQLCDRNLRGYQLHNYIKDNYRHFNNVNIATAIHRSAKQGDHRLIRSNSNFYIDLYYDGRNFNSQHLANMA